jgi:hypothetical protein
MFHDTAVSLLVQELDMRIAPVDLSTHADRTAVLEEVCTAANARLPEMMVVTTIPIVSPEPNERFLYMSIPSADYLSVFTD